jgi:hypothetical protein
MGKDITKEMSKICVNPNASKLLDRLAVSCNGPDVDPEFRNLLNQPYKKNSKLTLIKIFKHQPMTAIDIYRLATSENITEINQNDILYLFGGKIHLEGAEEWAEDYKKMAYKNGIPFSKYIKEFGIDLENEEHKAIFVFLDVLEIGEVKKISSPTAQIQIGNVRISNAPIPKDMRIKKGAIVGVHCGVVVHSFNAKDNSLIESIAKMQRSNVYFQQQLEKIKGKLIDMKNAYKNQTKQRYNIVKRFTSTY